MPLIQSPKKSALEKNVKTEMDGNPGKKNRAQNLAIAYSVQRKNRNKDRDKKANGGEVQGFKDTHPNTREHGVKGPINSVKGGPSPGPRDQFAAGGLAHKLIKEGEKSANREMVEPVNQRVGSEPSMDKDERASDGEMEHDRGSMYEVGDSGKPVANSWMAKGGHVKNGQKLKALEAMMADQKSEMAQPPNPGMAQPPMPPQGMAYGGESIMDEEMPDDVDPRAGDDPEMHRDEEQSLAEEIRDKHMRMSHGGRMKKKMAHGGLASNEWPEAGRLGFGMMEKESDPDEYSKHGIINYADGGLMGEDAEERREITEPTQQRLGSERYLDDLEMPMEYHSLGEAERQEDDAFAQENPSISESVRRKYMNKGGRAMYASGGYMSEEDENKGLDQNAIEHTNYMYKLNRQLGDHEMYSEEAALNDLEDPASDGMDSRDIGTDHYDMVDDIRRKYMRDRMMGSR